jgi:3-oxoacyl-[acyl-carrier-protein] synthase-3
MIGIGAIGTYVPARRIMNRGRMTEFAVTEQFLAEKIGFEAVARKEPSEETSDLCVKAVRALKAEPAVAAAGGLGAIQCVFLCTQNPDGRGLPHTSAIVHEKLGLPAACACLDISLGCSGFVHALAVARAFMEANGMTSGLLLTADPYSKIIDEHDKANHNQDDVDRTDEQTGDHCRHDGPEQRFQTWEPESGRMEPVIRTPVS